MTEMTKEQKNEIRSLVEAFRDAALKDLNAIGKGPQGQLDTWAIGKQLQVFVAYDTWLKLDDVEQEKKGSRLPKDHGPGRR